MLYGRPVFDGLEVPKRIISSDKKFLLYCKSCNKIKRSEIHEVVFQVNQFVCNIK